MGLYLCLVLAGEFVLIEEGVDTEVAAVATIWGTTVGLTLAHIFAFSLAARLLEGGRLERDTRASILYQVGMAVAVASVLSVPFLFTSRSTALEICSYMVAGAIGLTAFAVARAGAKSPLRAAGFAFSMLALAVVVVLVKAALSH